jgi:hypothetical protein
MASTTRATPLLVRNVVSSTHTNQDVCSVRGIRCLAADLDKVGHALEQRS